MLAIFVIFFWTFVVTTLAVNNGLARTPQLGYNTWNSFRCDVSEKLLLDTAGILIKSGLRDVGYNYVTLDDCWSAGRSDEGIIQVDRAKFPRGMRPIADELHSKNLMFGMYASAGEMTCAKYEGSLDWEEEDAEFFVENGVDYLKYDNCFHKGRFGLPSISYDRFAVMANALKTATKSTGRQILLSLCSWGEDYVHTWAMSLANSWRISGDVYDSFSRPDVLCACDNPADPACTSFGTHCSVLNIINRVAPFVDKGSSGGWNDMDMLEVGNGGMTDAEYVAHFSMWAALKSPLIIGADLRKLSPSALSILMHPSVIAINQDPRGKSARRVALNTSVPKDIYGQGETQIWSGILWGGDQVVLLLNAANEDVVMSTDLAEIFVADGPGGSALQSKASWDVFDLWAHRLENGPAEEILKADADLAGKMLRNLHWYNSTEIPYKQGLKQEDPRLFGKKIGVMKPGKTWTETVKRHSVRMYRLRNSRAAEMRYLAWKDEL